MFDGLVALLRTLYPKVTYVRNITDVDDKINARASERAISIQALCDETIEDFHCLLYTSPSPRDVEESRMPSSA